MDTQTIAILGVVVGSLAAVAAFANALAALVNTWRDSRGLTIIVEVKLRGDKQVMWTIEVWNRARTPNVIADLELFVDGKKMERPAIFSGLDGGLLRTSLPPYSYYQADLSIRIGDEISKATWETSERIEIRVSPVRGGYQRFRFRKEDLVAAS